MRFAPCLPLLLLWSSAVLAEPDSFGLGNGRNGALTVNTARTIINSAMRLPSGARRGETSVSVDTSTAPPTGGLVLVHQTMGFPASTPSGSTGQTSPGNVGRWELARVSSVVVGSPTVLQLSAPLMYSYTSPGAQVVTVPEYGSVNVTAAGSLVPPAWDGNSGGILAFLASGALINNGAIRADGAGFRGGTFTNNTSRTLCEGGDLSTTLGGSHKGEGVVVSRFGSASGRGNLVNAGGGGNCNNAGGGGGGHRGFGGTGGRSSFLDGSRDVGGLGGTLMDYSTVEALLFGGGGGAGEGDNAVGTSGGTGGGVVFVRAANISGTGRISANGDAALAANGEDGAGGGGAGGSVIVRTSAALNCGQVEVRGGSGGNVLAASFQLGPGGGGAGGSVLLNGTPVSCSVGSSGGSAGTTTASAGAHGPTHGAGVGGGGDVRVFNYGYATPATPTITLPLANAVDVSARPRIEGVADPGLRVVISVDGVEIAQVTTSTDGSFDAEVDDPLPPLSAGAHTVTAVSDGLGAYSRPAAVSFTVAAAPVIPQPIIVVPEAGEVMGPTPYIAGVAPNALTVGIYVDNRDEVIVPADGFGRFRYQIPADAPLAPGPHRVNAHGHGADDFGPDSPNTVFEVVQEDDDAGTTVPDAGDAGDSGTPGPDAGSGGDGGTVVTREMPVLVVPAEGELVDPTPLFAGVSQAGASVALEVDGTRVATVVADSTGAFRHVVPADSALASGAHAVAAYSLNGEAGTPGPRSPDTSFEVRGPTALDVGCGGCGASPVGAAGAWALLVGMAALLRRRQR
ncbi:adventurous gliding motility protein AgmC [Corallococcus terminator]